MTATLAFITKGLINVLIVYVLLVVAMYLLQGKLVFHPTAQVSEPKEFGLTNFEEIHLKTDDNLKLTAWYHKSAASKKAVVYFYGNADSLANYPEFFAKLAKQGYSVLGANYRGYGGSEGKPSEAGLYLDGKAAIEFLKSQGFDTKDIIVTGRSMGTGVASQMAMDYELGGVVLISPYSSLKKLASEIYWYLPVKYVGKYNFHSYEKYKSNKAPVLIIHGDRDALIPYKHAEDLYAVITSHKELVKYEGVDHIDIDMERIGNDMIRFFNAAE